MVKKTFNYGRYSYDYLLVKSERKTISLVIEPDKSIIVKAPLKSKSTDIEKFLKRKWSWMEKQLGYFEKFNIKKYKKEYISGESFMYLGRQYKLVVRKRKTESVKLQKGIIKLNTKRELRNYNHNKQLLTNWYVERGNKIFNERYQEVLKLFDFPFIPILDIRKMNKRWGSFLSNKKIYLNQDLIKTPKNCIDYVIIHELCHMVHKKHNKEFYNLLEKKCPDWELRKNRLEMMAIHF